jgi:4-amino-4-deoxy-L-arabinose transferase-like glycosyltransferase
LSKNKNIILRYIEKYISFIRNNPRRALTSLLFVAFVARFAFILMMQPDGYYFSDTRHYDNAANSILAGEGFGEKYGRSPLYPVFMALVYAVLGHSFTAMRIVEALLGVLLVWLIFQIAKKLFGETAAWASAILAAVFPHFILLTGILYSTNLFTVLLAASIYLLIIADEKMSYVWLAASSACAALAALTFPAFFFILPFWLLWLLFRRHATVLHNVSTALFFSMVFIACLTPWTVRNYIKYDRFTLVRPVPHTAFPNLDDLDAQKERIESGFKDTTKYLQENPNGTSKDNLGSIIGNYLRHPVHSVKYMANELIHFWALYPDRLDTKSEEYLQNIRAKDNRIVSLESTMWKVAQMMSVLVMLPVFLFAVVGLVFSRSLERRRLLLVLTAAALSIGYSLIYAEVRYRIPIEPYVLMFMSMGLIRVYKLYHALGAKPAINQDSLRLETATPSVQVSYRQAVSPTEPCE